MRRVNARNGFTIFNRENPSQRVELSAQGYNSAVPLPMPQYYDLLYPGDTIPSQGRVICRLSGDMLRKVFATTKKEVRYFQLDSHCRFQKIRCQHG
jgi:hypothetical protein